MQAFLSASHLVRHTYLSASHLVRHTYLQRMHGLFSDAGVGTGDLSNELVRHIVKAFLLKGFDLTTSLIVLSRGDGWRTEDLFNKEFDELVILITF